MHSLIECLEHWAKVKPTERLYGFFDLRGNEIASYTYMDYHRRTSALALYLRDRGLRHGDRALLTYAPGLELVAALAACARIGVISVPLALAAGRRGRDHSRLLAAARDCEPSAILCDSNALARLDDMPLGRLQKIVTASVQERTDASVNDPHAILFLQYTSGSTQRPRAVKVTHANVIRNAGSVLDHVPIGVSWLPQFHDMGLIGHYLFPLVAGGSNCGIKPADFLRRPALWFQTISRVRATFISAPNFGFEYCLRVDRLSDAELEGVDLSSLRVVMNGAEPVAPDMHARFSTRFARHGLDPRSVVAGYGLAEATLAVTSGGRNALCLDSRALRNDVVAPLAYDRVRESRPARIASSGRALPGVRLRIVEPRSRKMLDDDRVGEIWVGGPSVAPGYWNDAPSNAQTFEQAFVGAEEGDVSFLRTGDLGFLHRGELFVCGRAKDLIIVHGENFHPVDLESAVAASSPPLRAEGVAAFQDAHGELVILAEVDGRASLPSLDSIAATLRVHCGVDADLIMLVPLRTLVRTRSGKLSRPLTREAFAGGTIPCLSRRVRARSDPDPDEQARWTALLAKVNPPEGLADVDVGDLGLDSLTLVELQLAVQRALEAVGAPDLAKAFDGWDLQRLSSGDLLQILDRLRCGDLDGVVAHVRALSASRPAFSQAQRMRMLDDCRFVRQAAAGDSNPFAYESSQVHGGWLLTGATGFFGPFLLASLLKQTPATIHTLVRATDDAHALRRVRGALEASGLWDPVIAEAFESRVRAWRADIEQPSLGLAVHRYRMLSRCVTAVFHNAACVNYVQTYEAMRAANVEGTRSLLGFAFDGRAKAFHLISTTFIFGWTRKGVLVESDRNDEMEELDFGYAQSKWVAERLAFSAGASGLHVKVFRPSLISIACTGHGDRHDVAARLLAFMINHRVAVDTPNQVSLVPADIAASNIVAIACDHSSAEATYHVTADRYYNLTDLTRTISAEHGYGFRYFDILGFIEQLNLLCGPEDPVYPLLGFFNRSAPHMAEMQLKRYNNDRYRQARDASIQGRHDPSLRETAALLVAYLLKAGWIAAPPMPERRAESPTRFPSPYDAAA